MRIVRSVFLMLVSAAGLGAQAFPQTPQASPAPQRSPAASAAAVLHTLFEEKTVDAALFASSFLAQVPAATVQTILDGCRSQLGPFESIESVGTGFAALFGRGSVLVTIRLDASGKIAGLLLHDEISPPLRAAIERFLSAKTCSADWFSARFLAQVPLTQVQSIADRVHAQEGAYVKLDERDRRYFAVFEKAQNPIHGWVDDAGRFTGLLIGPPAPLIP